MKKILLITLLFCTANMNIANALNVGYLAWQDGLPYIYGINHTIKLIAPYASNGTQLGGTFTSSNTGTITVASDGTLTSKALGATLITWTENDGRGTLTLTAYAWVLQDLPGWLQWRDGSSNIFGVGNTAKVLLPPFSRDATGKVTLLTGSFSSDNTSVVTVDANGVLTSQGLGVATITWVQSGSSSPLYAPVWVMGNVLQWSNSTNGWDSKVCGIGQTNTLLVPKYVNPSTGDVRQPTGTFSSSNPAIATVATNGTVTTTGPGTATIAWQETGSTAQPLTKAVNVKAGATLNLAAVSSCRKIGDTIQVTANLPSSAHWTTSNQYTATADGSAQVIHCVGYGSGTITISYSDDCGTHTGQITTTVMPNVGVNTPDNYLRSGFDLNISGYPQPDAGGWRNRGAHCYELERRHCH